MSRSYRRTPIIGNCNSKVQHEFKKKEHRSERRRVKVCLQMNFECPHPKEYGNEWSSPRDGKHLLSDPNDDNRKWMRK